MAINIKHFAYLVYSLARLFHPNYLSPDEMGRQVGRGSIEASEEVLADLPLRRDWLRRFRAGFLEILDAYIGRS